eukprot:Protomagalhaensia_wolfi_Nauph_80__2331@NODE_2529_length_1066_cov_113_503408_g1982_i0_p1_GENE_NODE_2529_length_1066_cov_113_503408_g1982_i0NODE_2529_length_1066_cov_113_503408_g1982_i0_p1_ORF_typecomplete_len230_score40_52Citrate_synt/PF00285_21/4e03Citrate_synt/PF00285_21/1_1e11_NODE_2529_length_1066_cov_113_503408_g1982_i0154843
MPVSNLVSTGEDPVMVTRQCDGAQDAIPLTASSAAVSQQSTIAGTVTLTDENGQTDEEATLKLPDGREFKLNILRPTYGKETILDVQHLFKEGKVLLYDPGFNSVASCRSTVTVTDGDKGECCYRGYSVAELVDKHDFLNVAYLLLNGELPNGAERLDFESRIKSEMLVHSRLKEFITRFVPGAHPMSILASVLAAMASFYADPMDAKFKFDKNIRQLACIRLIAKIVS